MAEFTERQFEVISHESEEVLDLIVDYLLPASDAICGESFCQSNISSVSFGRELEYENDDLTKTIEFTATKMGLIGNGLSRFISYNLTVSETRLWPEGSYWPEYDDEEDIHVKFDEEEPVEKHVREVTEYRLNDETNRPFKDFRLEFLEYYPDADDVVTAGAEGVQDSTAHPTASLDDLEPSEEDMFLRMQSELRATFLRQDVEKIIEALGMLGLSYKNGEAKA